MMGFESKKIHNKLFLICFTTILCMAVSGCNIYKKTEAKTDTKTAEETSNKSEDKNKDFIGNVSKMNSVSSKSENGSENRDTIKSDTSFPVLESNKEEKSDTLVSTDVSDIGDTEVVQVSYEDGYSNINVENSDYSIVSIMEVSEDSVVYVSDIKSDNTETEQSDQMEETSIPVVISEPSETMQETSAEISEEVSKDISEDISDQNGTSNINSDSNGASYLWCITNKITILNNGCTVDKGTYLKVLDSEPDAEGYFVQWYQDVAKVRKVDVEVFEIDADQEEMILLRKTAGVITMG